MPAMFELFNAGGELSVRVAKLPHWYQPGVTYFVTFRTADSIPQSLLRSWHKRRDDWLRLHRIDPRSSSWKSRLRETPALEREYGAVFTREFMGYLDRGCGACVLRNQRYAGFVAESLRHFDEDRYLLGDFVIMPNHVHLLVCLQGETEIERQCRSWKKFAAGKINRAMGRRGRFWQEESFDHLVRSIPQFEYLQRYIAENPVKSRLRPGEYLLCSSTATECGPPK
jgi:type I restriction enzyme R subunit